MTPERPFPTDVDRCNGYAVKAVGSKGSSVRVRAPELQCASTNPG